MKKKSKKVLIITSCTGMIIFSIIGYLLLYPNSPINRTSAIESAKTWARLEAFPNTASKIKADSKGSMFSREFIITFDAPQDDIENWLSKSPGTAEVVPKLQVDGSYRYDIIPGGGASFAELFFFKEIGKVLIRTYWS